MSSTNKTTTIELSQYVSTDKPTYLVDYNGDMLKIDNAIAADRDSITTAQNKANTADGKADINKTSIDNLNLQVNGDPDDPSDVGIAGDLTAVEGTVNTITALLGNGHPTTSDQTVIGAINGLEGAIAPREDGANLANSYSQGEQFARGGSVYEALTSLTADTPFASLVLNTDYKVADTLVEQIANAGAGTLPVGYYIKNPAIEITVTADGVKTFRELLLELGTAALTYVQALPVGEIAHFTFLQANGVKSAWNNYSYDRDATSVEMTFSSLRIQSGTLSFFYGKCSSNNAYIELYNCNCDISAGTYTNNDKLVDVPTSGDALRLKGELLAAF